jgi:hypothetical protein
MRSRHILIIKRSSAGVNRYKYITCNTWVKISIMKSTWSNFHSIYWDSRAATGFEHYMLFLRRCCTNGTWYIACVLCHLAVARCHSQLTLYAWNIPNAVCVAPPENEQVMLETCRGSWCYINWMKSASRWFYYTEILWCTISKTNGLKCLGCFMLLSCLLFSTANICDLYKWFVNKCDGYAIPGVSCTAE